MYMNQVTLVGRLTRDPELKALPNGTNVTAFGLATSEKYRDKENQLQETTEFHNITVFGNQANACAQFLKKGGLVLIVGKLKTRSWEKDGVKHYRTEVVAKNVVFGPLKAQESDNSSDAPAVPDYPEEEINPEDIPF